MATNTESLRFEGEGSDLTRTIEQITAAFAEMAKQQGIVFRGTAKLNSKKDGLQKLTGTLTKTNDAGQKLTSSFKLLAKGGKNVTGTIKNVIDGSVSLADALQLTNRRFKLDTAVIERNRIALEKLNKAQAAAAATRAKQLAETRRQSSAVTAVERVGTIAGRGRAVGTTTEQLKVAQAEAALVKLARTTKVTGAQIDKIFKDVRRGEIKRYEGELARVQQATFNLIKANRQLGTSAVKAYQASSMGAERATTATEKTSVATSGLVKNLTALAKTTGLALFISGVFRLQQALIDGTQAAVEYSKRIAEVRTIQGALTLSSEQWSTELRNLSDAFGIPIIDQAEAAYQTLSNQILQGERATNFLTAANKLALTAVTDTSNAVNLLTSVINSFGLDSARAEVISAKLFKTVELGRVRIDEMSDTLGRIGVPAAKLGIRFEELLASISVTTRQGIRFNEAATLLRGIIQKLVKPTVEMRDLLASIGFSSSEAAIQTLGFGGVLAELDKKARGSSTEIGKLFNRIRASTGALIFAGEGVTKFNADLAKIDAQGIEGFAKTTDIVLKDVGKRFEIELTRIQNFFKQDIGQVALAAIVDLSDSLGGLSNVLKDTASVSVSLARVLKFVLAPAAAVAALAFTKLAIAFAATPFGAITLAITGTIAALTALDFRQREALKSAQEFTQSIERQAESFAKLREQRVAEENRVIVESIKARNQAALDAIRTENAAIFNSNKQRIENFKDLRRETDTINKSIISSVKNIASQFKKEGNRFAAQAEKTAEEVSKAFLSAGKQLFDFDISVVADQSQLRLIESQLAQLRSQQQTAAASADKATFNRVTANIKALEKQRFDTAARIQKSEQSADQEVFKARAELQRAQASRDAKRIQSAADALKDAERAQKRVGRFTADELNVTKQIEDVRRKLSRQPFGSAEAKALRIELDGLRKLQVGINDQVSREEQFRQQILKTFEDEKRLRQELAAQLRKDADIAFKKELERRRLAEELVDLDKQRRAFNLETLLKQTGPEGIEEINRQVAKQEGIFSKTLQLQKELGVGADRRLKLEQELATIQEATAKRRRSIENELLTERIRKADEANQRDLTQARKLAEVDNKRIDNFVAQLEAVRRGVQDVSEADFVARVRGRAETGPITARNLQQQLLGSLDNLINTIARERRAPGTEDIGDAILRLRQQLTEVPTRTRERRARFETPEEREVVKVLARVAEQLQGARLEQAFVAIGEVARIRERITGNLETRRLFERGAAQPAEQLTLDALLQQVGKRIEEIGKARAEVLQPKPSPEVKKTVVQNRVDAEKATRKVVIDNRVAAEEAAIKTRQTAAKKEEETRLRRQKARQEAIRGAGQGLTGQAARLAEADERARRRKLGLDSPFLQRKKEAEQRAAQRERNIEFFRQRQAKALTEPVVQDAIQAAKSFFQPDGPTTKRAANIVEESFRDPKRKEEVQFFLDPTFGQNEALDLLRELVTISRDQLQNQLLPFPRDPGATPGEFGAFDVTQRTPFAPRMPALAQDVEQTTNVNITNNFNGITDTNALARQITPAVTQGIERASRTGNSQIRTR